MDFFADHGIHCIVDGQFGSTGKGALAAFLAAEAIDDIDFGGCFSNAGPNSGHTFYYGDDKHVLKQLPSFAVYHALAGKPIPVFLTGGAIIDPAILCAEAERYPNIDILVHPNAAVIGQEDKEAEHSGSIAAVAGTRSGTGAVLARKVMRDPSVVFKQHFVDTHFPKNVILDSYCNRARMRDVYNRPYFMEVSQGFSLGLNSRFYPKVTSRECTAAQGLADAGIAPQALQKVYLSLRTFPIRVGNVDGFSSGDHYPDQRETTWEEISQQPELTTVTQRVRRVFTFSEMQAEDAILANQPNFVFLNFLNYMDSKGQDELFSKVSELGNFEFDILRGYGPKVGNIHYD